MGAENLEIPEIVYDNVPTRLIGDAFLFNSTLEFKPVPYMGLLAIVEGAEYYRKGATNGTITYMNNLVKEVIKQAFKNPIIFLFPNRAVNSFNHFFTRCFQRTFKSEYLCRAAFQLEKMLEIFLREIGIGEWKKTAHNLAQIIEFDDRYRYTLQDMATECDIESMRKSPRKEIKRLIEMYRQRENHIREKTVRMVKPLLYILLIPKYKRAFIKSCIYLKGMSYDDSDFYWTCTKGDTEYKFGGKTQLERIGNRKLPALFTIEDGKVIKIP